MNSNNTTGKYILDKKGNPVEEPDLFKWADWFETSGKVRKVKHTKVGEYFVSTVFLGLDHGWGMGRPILYETMVFTSKDDIPIDDIAMQERYLTRLEAQKGHNEVVDKVRDYVKTHGKNK